MSSNRLSWITLTCQEGLVYDKNLRSCAIPPEEWECGLSSSEEHDKSSDDDNKNVYGIENLETLKVDDSDEEEEDRQSKDDSDGFLEIIDGDKNLKSISNEVINDDEEVAIFSGDGSVEAITPSSMTVRMITTQVQRLTQLVNNFANSDQGITPDDLNSFLDTQKIHADDFQQTDPFGKTPLPENGKVHPEIQNEVLSRQNMFKELTTSAMDKSTTTMRPIYYADKEPITEIKLKGGQGSDGASHQIVVNRPEGSVLFNVPPSNDQKHMPYLSQDILKTILEISKQMVTQNHQKSEPSHISYQPQPFYYAVPIPILSSQNNLQNFYGLIPNHTTTSTTTTKLPKRRKTSPIQLKNKVNNEEDYTAEFANNYGQNYPGNVQSSYMKNQQNYPLSSPSSYLKNQQNLYSNYPSYYTQPQQQQAAYNPFYNPQSNYYFQQYPTYENDQNQFSYESMNYGKRPLVIDSSAPSYLDQPQQQQTHSQGIRKESFALSPSLMHNYENDDEYDGLGEESEDANYHENMFDDTPAANDPLDGLICTNVLARQANKTNCYKYYVCNAKTKEVLSYSCPLMTAFNDQTKFCDASSYETCKKVQSNEQSAFKNKRIVQAHKALLQAKRDSEKAQKLAILMKKQTQNFLNSQNQFNYKSPPQHLYQNQYGNFKQPSYPQPASNLFLEDQITEEERPRPQKRITTKSQKKKIKKNVAKVKCKNPGNIVDPSDKFSYWHCFKDQSDQRMKRIHKKCSANLMFCASTRFCSSTC